VSLPHRSGESAAAQVVADSHARPTIRTPVTSATFADAAWSAYNDAFFRINRQSARLNYRKIVWLTAETADLLWLWFGPNSWRTLVTETGWSWDRAETAIRETAIAALYDGQISVLPQAWQYLSVLDPHRLQ
jgi:hypothetical protein